jgi:hypothetical protein
MSACMTCGAEPCVNTSFCAMCREADQRKARGERPRYIDTWGDPPAYFPRDWDRMPIDELWRLFNERRPTAQTTVEAIMLAVRERGLGALQEPGTKERLARCDAAAIKQIDQRITKLREVRGVDARRQGTARSSVPQN